MKHLPLAPYLELSLVKLSIKLYQVNFSSYIGPLSPMIHSGLEWPQFLKSLIVLCLFVLCLSGGQDFRGPLWG